ncbi:MAG: Hpt domain-containing protein [Pseudomonadota bacterium]
MNKPDPAASQPAAAGTAPAPLVDVDAGVERLMGNRPVYLRALARFRHDYRSAGAAIGTAIETGNLALAQRLVHTLKGAAGMIEAPSLHAAALALEAALRAATASQADLPSLRAPFVRLDAELAHVLRELDAMTDLAEAGAPAPRLVGSENVMVRLRTLLDIGDGEAVDLVEDARDVLVAQLGEEEYGKLGAAVADFDFERALALLDQSGQTG